MPFSLLFCLLGLLAAGATAAPALSETETRWLGAGAPVLAYARQLGLPLDIIVQPRARPGDVPFALGFDGGRCKLVLSMRDNPRAEQILERVDPAEHGLLIEAMTAHEVGHCWRYAHGEWHAMPAGMEAPAPPAGLDPALRGDAAALGASRREEGFADLAALAWVRTRHPARYASVYAWLERVRRAQPVRGGSHDTAAWLALAADGAVFAPAGDPFEQAGALWRRALIGAE